MSNQRYIELVSTYRNRTEWPLPAEFEVPIAESGNKTKLNALDPVSLMAPFITFDGNFDVTGGVTLTGVVSALTDIGASTDVCTVIVEVTAGEMVQTEKYYVGAVLNDTTTGQLRRITDFKYLETDGGVDRGSFDVMPCFSSIAAGDSIVVTNPSSNAGPNAHIFIPFGEIFQENYLYDKIITDDTLGESLRVISFDSTTKLAELDGTFSGGWSATDSYSIRYQAPIETGTLAASTINTFELPATFTTNYQYYKNSFIRILDGAAAGDIRRITTYGNEAMTSRVGTVYPAFSAIPGLASFEILFFSKDNFVPLNYAGSLVSQQQEVCYEIELIDLILPNVILDVAEGNRIVFHPYVYVELNTTTSMSNSNIIYSNNPNSAHALFRVPIHDIRDPIISAFIRLRGDYKQTVKFKPNDNLHFKVTMPNGEVFKTKEAEYYSPSLPNPCIQVSASFSIRRV